MLTAIFSPFFFQKYPTLVTDPLNNTARGERTKEVKEIIIEYIYYIFMFNKICYPKIMIQFLCIQNCLQSELLNHLHIMLCPNH